jgi:hypothetical protein
MLCAKDSLFATYANGNRQRDTEVEVGWSGFSKAGCFDQGKDWNSVLALLVEVSLNPGLVLVENWGAVRNKNYNITLGSETR